MIFKYLPCILCCKISKWLDSYTKWVFCCVLFLNIGGKKINNFGMGMRFQPVQKRNSMDSRWWILLSDRFLRMFSWFVYHFNKRIGRCFYNQWNIPLKELIWIVDSTQYAERIQISHMKFKRYRKKGFIVPKRYILRTISFT